MISDFTKFRLRLARYNADRDKENGLTYYTMSDSYEKNKTHLVAYMRRHNNTVSAVTVKSLSSMPGDGGFGEPSEAVQGAAANTIDTDCTYLETTYSSTDDDENRPLA